MKKIYTFITLFVFFNALTSAQIHIGENLQMGNSSLLEFDNSPSNTRGIILSAVETAPVLDPDFNNGTFIYDKSTQQVKMFENGVWINLSDKGDNSVLTQNGRVINTSQDIGKGVVIGQTLSENNQTKGALILEDESKALVLPHIANPHINVKSPYPGMMCYDTTSNTFAVFDGNNWNYWE